MAAKKQIKCKIYNTVFVNLSSKQEARSCTRKNIHTLLRERKHLLQRERSWGCEQFICSANNHKVRVRHTAFQRLQQVNFVKRDLHLKWCWVNKAKCHFLNQLNGSRDKHFRFTSIAPNTCGTLWMKMKCHVFKLGPLWHLGKYFKQQCRFK